MSNELWQRQESDTDASFKAFNIYLRMPKRSLQKAADVYYARTASNVRQFAKWSSENNWQARVQAYDAHLNAIDLADYEDKRLASRKTRQKIVQSLETLLSKVMVENQNDLNPQNISQIASAAKTIMGESRQEFNDLPTQKTDNNNSGDITIKVIYEDALADSDD